MRSEALLAAKKETESGVLSLSDTLIPAYPRNYALRLPFAYRNVRFGRAYSLINKQYQRVG